MNLYFYKHIKSIIEYKKVQKNYLEAKFWNSEGTLLYEKFKIEVNKVPSEYQNFAFR